MSDDEALPPSFQPRQRPGRPDKPSRGAEPVNGARPPARDPEPTRRVRPRRDAQPAPQERSARPERPAQPERPIQSEQPSPARSPQRRSILHPGGEQGGAPGASDGSTAAYRPVRPRKGAPPPPPDQPRQTQAFNAQQMDDEPLPPSFAPGSNDPPAYPQDSYQQSNYQGSGYPPGPGGPGQYPPGPYDDEPDWDGGEGPPSRPRRRRRRPRWGRRILIAFVLLLVLLIAWPVGLGIWAQGRMTTTEALSGAPDTPGTTYLLAGSDARGGNIDDGTEGERADTIILLHVPEDGTSSMVSLPRDSLVSIPGHGDNKLNAAYSLGGPALLVETVEELSGLTVDHFVEIGMDGLSNVVDAVGGVELCLDYDVSDERSQLEWTAGCHVADGETALAFARMRYSDPRGDIGRGERQRQVVGAIMQEVATPRTLIDPRRHVELVRAGTDNLTMSEGTGAMDMGRLALNFRNASNEGFVGTPPIADPDYRPGGIGSSVLLDPEQSDQFWADVASGDITPESYPPPTP